jgi:SAM-dependent methyltransferase
MQKPTQCFFILSSARSGSTSLAAILNEADNGVCVSEPMPNLNVETRQMMDGRLENPEAVLENSVLARVRAASETVDVYGEKNVTYGPFIPFLDRMLDAKFVFLHRDGRDVVRSLMDWHGEMFGSIYRECRDVPILSDRARSATANLLVHHDTSDYARPRPLPGEALYDAWEDLTREEMCAYYWARINTLYQTQLEKLKAETWMDISYTDVTPKTVMQMADFCGLSGLDHASVSQMLEQRINSLADRQAGEDVYPSWPNWDSGQRDRFDAAPMMARLGYYTAGQEWKPQGYGQWWAEHDGGLDWYTWMFDSRRQIHTHLIAWVGDHHQPGDPINRIADFGCGLGVGYADAFADKQYVGVDIAEKNIAWCRQHRRNPQHTYLYQDFVIEPLKPKADLVFSSGTLDNTYDIDNALATMVASSRKWIHATFYRGWFPYLDEHRYTWSDEHACMYADVSASRLDRTLKRLGCQNIQIYPLKTGRPDIPMETLVFARVPETPAARSAN